MGDEETYTGLMNLVRPVTSFCRMMGALPMLGVAGYIGSDLLASSIRCCAFSQSIHNQFWRGDPRDVRSPLTEETINGASEFSIKSFGFLRSAA